MLKLFGKERSMWWYLFLVCTPFLAVFGAMHLGFSTSVQEDIFYLSFIAAIFAQFL